MSATDSTVCQNQTSYRSWLLSWFRWVPTSSADLEQAEEKVLSYLKIPYKSMIINIGKGTTWKEDNIMQTITMNTDCSEQERQPLVLIHGFCSAIGLWSLNLDSFAANRPVYAFDLLGFGRSSRPAFSSVALEAEYQLVQSIEDWREKMGLERFILLGHSMGGFLAASYALQHPHRVSHLILADPWGFPERPMALTHKYDMPIWVKIVSTLLQPFNPLAGLRVAGPWGPKLVDRIRPDLRKKFEPLIEDNGAIPNYIFHCNAQVPSGEAAFKALTAQFGWAKHPMINRIPELRADVPMTFIYGSRSWIDRQPGINLKFMRPNSYVDVQVIQGAGHHVYADRAEQFNCIVQNVCNRADIVEAANLNQRPGNIGISPASTSSIHLSLESMDGESLPSTQDSPREESENTIDPERI